MNLKKLREFIKSIPEEYDNLNVWLGTDSGEGWLPLECVGIMNALHAPICVDEMSDKEHKYDCEKIPKGYTADPDDKKSAWAEIIVLGDRFCLAEQKGFRIKMTNLKRKSK